MGAVRLSERKLRRIARDTGLPVIRAWGHGGYIHDFVTRGHLHGLYWLKTGEWRIARVPAHYDTCPGGSAERHAPEEAMFPDGVPPLTTAEAAAQLDAYNSSE